MSENQNSVPNDSDSTTIKETSLIENNNIPANVSIKRQISDPKLEKKVTFARLLSKVSAEMNSSSEIEMAHVSSDDILYILNMAICNSLLLLIVIILLYYFSINSS